jgi:hypothetical protein
LPDATWRVRTLTDRDGRIDDVIERSGPGELRIMVGRSSTCRLPSGGRLVYDAPYMAPGYGNQASELSLEGGLQVAGMCAPLARGDFLVTTVGYIGSLVEAGPARPVLTAVLAAVEGRPSDDRTRLGATSDKDDGKLWAHLDFGVLIGTPQGGPNTDASTAGVVGLNFLYASPKRGEYIGWSTEFGVAGGGGSHAVVPWDVHLSFGGAARFGPLFVTPLFGLGGNGMQADPAFFNIPSSFYWMYGGYVAIKWSDSGGLGLGGFKVNRVVEPYRDEVRLSARVFFDHWGAAITYSAFTASDGTSSPYALTLTGALGF